ncbi:MAG: HD domain-containing protein [Thermaerobacter sp.]|nr:HD domain-containing protein [Thermaerobacter sp.]
MSRRRVASREDDVADGLGFLTSYGILVPPAVVGALAALPEYSDEPLLDGRVRITRRIAGGTLRHVGHAVRLVLELEEAGMALPAGVSLADLLRCLLYHDLGKRQPELRPGDVVVPSRVFEDGKLHAARSAALLREHGEDGRVVEEMVRYHHHGEGELPEGLARGVRGALRTVQLVDGLSAAVTRRDAVVYVVQDELCSSRVGVEEVHPGTRRVVYHMITTGGGGGKKKKKAT